MLNNRVVACTTVKSFVKNLKNVNIENYLKGRAKISILCAYYIILCSNKHIMCMTCTAFVRNKDLI